MVTTQPRLWNFQNTIILHNRNENPSQFRPAHDSDAMEGSDRCDGELEAGPAHGY
jgi:hypothetical protein